MNRRLLKNGVPERGQSVSGLDRQLIWLSRHLGHSSLKVTSDVYGHFGRQERKAEAELMAGVFGV